MGRTPKAYGPTGMGIAINIPARRHDVLADILIDTVRASASGEDAVDAATRIAGSKGAEHGPASGRGCARDASAPDVP